MRRLKLIIMITADDRKRILRLPRPFGLVCRGVPAALEHKLEMKLGDVQAFIRSSKKPWWFGMKATAECL